jgi:hypothetical protein
MMKPFQPINYDEVQNFIIPHTNDITFSGLHIVHTKTVTT